MHRARIRALAVLGLAALATSPASVALAHGETIQGHLAIEMGFGTEPAYAGLPNSVQVLLSHDGQPVVDAKGMTVDVSFGDATTTMPLEPNFEVGGDGEPGDYRAFFVPSQPGPYTFHLHGKVDGETLDVEMTSGPGTFVEVTTTKEAAFPPADTPTLDEIAGRIETESTRVSAANDAAAAADDRARSARTLAMIGVIVGALGVIAGIAGIAAARRAAP